MNRDGSTMIGRRPPARAVAVSLLGPAAATAIGIAAGTRAPVTAASLYMLAVVAAAAYGGAFSGVVAALLSFAGLNYFFTLPFHTLKVASTSDLVALTVFLAVAAIVGWLVARIFSERTRAEHREQEGVLLNAFATALLSSRPLASVLEEFGRTMAERLGLSRCAIAVDGLAHPIVVATSDRSDDAVSEIPVVAGSVRFGEITVARTGRPLSEADRRSFTTFATQLGLVLERTRLDIAARDARTDAEVSQIRAALFSSVTHDLRTPLASIKAGVTSLLDAEAHHDDAQRSELLQTILEETDRLNRLVGNILNLARARAGALTPEVELTPFEDVVEGVLHRMRTRLQGFTVRTLLRPDVPAIWIDPIQLDQALTNIVENAVRNSPAHGEITVSVAPWQGGVQVRVADRGPGIPPDERERVFEPFYTRAGKRTEGGTGLGLAIARAAVAAHRGRIWIEGAPAGGTTVVIELPPGAPPEANPQP